MSSVCLCNSTVRKVHERMIEGFERNNVIEQIENINLDFFGKDKKKFAKNKTKKRLMENAICWKRRKIRYDTLELKIRQILVSRIPSTPPPPFQRLFPLDCIDLHLHLHPYLHLHHHYHHRLMLRRLQREEKIHDLATQINIKPSQSRPIIIDLYHGYKM